MVQKPSAVAAQVGHAVRSNPQSNWFEYIDGASGRLYYHHTVTKVTQWTAPLEGVSFRESDGR